MAAADATVEDVKNMLALNETLFVEHKGTEPEYQLAKAVASFANQLGGWVLVNIASVDGKEPRPAGPLAKWVTKAPSAVDAVRDRLNGQVDPMPPFEARTFAVVGSEKDVLVIRVYESADTPHIAKDGAIYVRGIAQDRRPDKYEAKPIENQQILRGLVERGTASSVRVSDLLKPRQDLPLANGGIGIEFENVVGGLVPFSRQPVIAARLAPYTLAGRFEGWARSLKAVGAGRHAIGQLAATGDLEINPHSQGFSLQAHMAPERAPTTEGGVNLAGPVRMSVDAVGIVSASTAFAQREENDWCPPLTLKGFAERYVAPLVTAPAMVLKRGAILGRVRCHLWFWGMGGLIRIDDEGKTMQRPGQVPFEGEITLPTDAGDLDQFAAEAARAFGREGGLDSFE